MIPAARRQHILERVAAEQSLDYASLAAELGVSIMTVRRDVADLERDGYLRRTRGGATAQLTRSFHLLMGRRALTNAPQKRLIGRRAAELVDPGETLFLGVGSTTGQFAQYLPKGLDLTVVTPSLSHASLLTSRGIRVVSTGGSVTDGDFAQTGLLSEQTIRRFHATSCILGAAGVSGRVGVTEAETALGEIHRAMVERAQRVLVLADGSKAGVVSSFVVALLDEVSVIVTDPDGLGAMTRECSTHDVRIVVAAAGNPADP